MNDLFVVESVRPEIRLCLFLTELILLLLPALGGWFWLAIAALILTLPLVTNSLFFHFQPARIEIRLGRTNILQRIFPGSSRTSSGNPLIDWHRREEELARTPGIGSGRCVRSIPRSRLDGFAYFEGSRFGTILITLKGCKPRTGKRLWYYRLQNHGKLYVIHTSRDNAKVGEVLRLLEDYMDPETQDGSLC